MRVLLTGAGGMLAQALRSVLPAWGHEVVALDRAALDVTDAAAVARALDAVRPEVVIQGAAYTAVDRAEEEEELATRVNAESTGFLARWCQKSGALLVYPSTDYVFSGEERRPYRPGDPTAPLNAYGRSKLAGERAAAEAGRALVVRTSWLYGAGGGNFVETIRRLSRERDSLQVVDDQLGRPTWTVSLAGSVARLLKAGVVGTFHAADGGEPVSWYGFAREILAQEGAAVALAPVPTSAFPRPARRPCYSVLDCSRTEEVVGSPLPDWRESLSCYLRGEAGAVAGVAAR